MCVTVHALLSGWVLRVRRDGHRATPDEVRTLLAAGIARDTIRAALEAARPCDAVEHAIAVLESVAATR